MSETLWHWRADLEHWDQYNDLPDDREVMELVGSYEEIAFDPRKVLKWDLQGRQGSCAGHSLSTGTEWIRTLATKEIGVQLSRAMGYYETQRLDGISGDRGSTIMGGRKLLETVGLCREELWPYPTQYNNARPKNWQAVLEDAAKHKVVRANRLTSYDGVRVWLGSGQGFVHSGIPWSSAYAQPVVESFSSGSGGHALPNIFLSERKDRKSRPYIWILNSHPSNNQYRGWSEWSPSFIDGAIASRSTVFCGLSDMPNVKPRAVDWIANSPWIWK